MSAYITTAQKDAANGVPSLDSNLLINIDRIPTFSILQQYPLLIMDKQVATPTTNEVRMKRISGARIKINKIYAVLDAGTLTLDLKVAGVSQGLNLAITTSSVSAFIPPSDIIIDARSGPISLGIEASNLSTTTVPDNLEVVIEADYVAA